MQIGDVYLVKPAFASGDSSGASHRIMRGRVVYIHPKRRYAVLEFPGESGTARESFRPEELTQKVREHELR